MIEKCFEIGTIQAFLDGELDNNSLAQVAHHVSLCDDCARMLAEAESESAFAFAALDTELNYLVPTERIRTNLYERITAEKKPFWKRIFGEGFRWTNPSTAAFAGLILVAGIFATLLLVRENRAPIMSDTAKANQPKSIETRIANNQSPTGLIADKSPSAENRESEKTHFRIEKPNLKPALENRPTIQNANYRLQKSAVKNLTAKTENTNANGVTPTGRDQGLIGEESYQKTIATLDETVNSRKDQGLRPSERVAFEKDLAVVNDSIAKMQKEVRSNPKSEAAKELLRVSYQNKIDLLNSVADKTELMALR